MKKILLVLSLVMASMVNVNAQGTYRGFLDLGPSFGNGFSLDFTTAHGWQFNQNWFLGAGVGAVNVIETYNSDTNDEMISVPIFAKVRFDNLSEKVLTFFTEGNIGYCVHCNGGSAGFPLYASFMLGMRHRLTEKMGLNFGVGFSIVPSESYESNSYYYYDDDDSALKFNIKVGVDF